MYPLILSNALRHHHIILMHMKCLILNSKVSVDLLRQRIKSPCLNFQSNTDIYLSANSRGHLMYITKSRTPNRNLKIPMPIFPRILKWNGAIMTEIIPQKSPPSKHMLLIRIANFSRPLNPSQINN